MRKYTRTPIESRFWIKVQKSDGCWNWTGAQNGVGYGVIGSGGKHGSIVCAHRLSYEIAHGPIPEGLVIDHLCRNRACVNPDHLEPVTQGENVARGNRRLGRKPGPNTLKSHCPQGHPYSGDNLKINADGHRSCRQCLRDTAMRHKWEKRGVDPATREPFRTAPRVATSSQSYSLPRNWPM